MYLTQVVQRLPNKRHHHEVEFAVFSRVNQLAEVHEFPLACFSEHSDVHHQNLKTKKSQSMSQKHDQMPTHILPGIHPLRFEGIAFLAFALADSVHFSKSSSAKPLQDRPLLQSVAPREALLAGHPCLSLLLELLTGWLTQPRVDAQYRAG